MNKKILYIAPYREMSGSGNSARNYIEALHKQGHDVCVAPIYMSAMNYPEEHINKEILALEGNHLENYDIVIQHCHPLNYSYDYRFSMNIGIFQFNSQNIHPGFLPFLNLMDRIIVNSKLNASIVKKIGLDTENKLRVVPQVIDAEIDNSDLISYPWRDIKNSPYIFYTVGDLSMRKNIFKIISAFIKQFRSMDNVELVIKISSGEDKEKSNIEQEIRERVSKIYSELKINSLFAKSPRIIIGDIDSKTLRSIHANSDCYIDASLGSNFGYSVLQAALFGNDIIVNKNISSAEIVETPYLLNSYLVNIQDSSSYKFIDNRTEDYWMDVEYSDLCEKISLAYLNRYDNRDMDVDLLIKQSNLLEAYSFKNSDKILC